MNLKLEMFCPYLMGLEKVKNKNEITQKNLHILLVHLRIKKIEVIPPVTVQLPAYTWESYLLIVELTAWWIWVWNVSYTSLLYLFLLSSFLKAIFPLDTFIVLTASFMPNLRTTHLSSPKTHGNYFLGMSKHSVTIQILYRAHYKISSPSLFPSPFPFPSLSPLSLSPSITHT